MSMPTANDDVFRHYRGAEPAPADVAPPAVAADFGVRAGARILDAILGVLLGGALGFTLGILIGLLELGGALPRGSSLKLRGLDVAGVVFSFVGSMLYQAISESGGATAGKWICGLRVCGVDLSPDGVRLLRLRPCSFGAALLRTVAYLVDAQFCGAVGYLVMSKSLQKQRLGDQWASTTVVVASSMTTPPTQSPLLGVFLGLLAWGGCILLGLAIRLF